MHKPMSMCKTCKYSNDPYVPCNGTATADLLVLGESPGKEEIKKGIPFVGPSGKLLREVLGDTDCLICNAFPCFTKNFDYVVAEKCFRLRFPGRFEHVLAVGKVSQQLVSMINDKFDHSYTLYHPAYVLRGGMRESEWRDSVEKCLQDIRKQ